MKRTSTTLPTCRFCTKPIAAGDKSIATGAGPMHLRCCAENKRAVEEGIERAIADGAHSRESHHVCGMCRREFTGGIYFKTLGGVECCKPCARLIDQVVCNICRKPIRDEAEDFYSSRYGLVHRTCLGASAPVIDTPTQEVIHA